MEMEIAEKTDVSWLQMLHRRADGMNTICLPSSRPYSVAGTASAIVLQAVPILDWPVNLFDDAKSYH